MQLVTCAAVGGSFHDKRCHIVMLHVRLTSIVRIERTLQRCLPASNWLAQWECLNLRLESKASGCAHYLRYTVSWAWQGLRHGQYLP